MKKGTLRFIGLAMGLCLVVPLAACTNKPAEQDTTEYKISITNKAELQGEWVVSQGGRKVSVSVEPEANVTDLVQSGEIKFASSNEAVIKFIGQMAQPQAAGSAKLTVEYKGAKDEVDVTIADKLPEPAHITGKTIAEILAEKPTANLAIYDVVGYVTGWQSGKEDATKYGNFYIGDTAETKTADSALVYGSSATATFTWSGSEYSYDYSNQDFLTHELTSGMKIGSKVTAQFVVYYYGTTLELGGKIVNVEAGANVPATAVAINLNNKAIDALNAYANENIYLTSKLTPENSTDEVVWSSEDDTVATVAKGYVKPLKAGTTKIIAKANDSVKAEVALTVAAAREVVHAGTEADPYTPLEAAIKAAGLENKAAGEADVWVKGVAISSSYYEKGNSHNIWLADEQDNSVFEIYGGLLPEDFDVIAATEVVKANAFKGYEVTAKGRLTPYNNTMELSSYKDADKNTVYPSILNVVKAPSVPATAIALDKEEAEVAVGSKITLNANLTPFYSEDAVTWLSSDSTKATVASGVVTGVAAGEVTITAFLDANENGAKDEGELFAQAAITVTLNNTLKITVDNTGIGATALTEKLEKTYQIKDGNVVVEFSSGSKDKANYSEFMIPKNGGYIKVNSIPSTLKIDYVDIDFYKYPDNTKVYAAADASSEEALVTGTEQPSSSFTDSKVRRFAIDGENFYLANPSTYDVNFFSITIVLVAKAA